MVDKFNWIHYDQEKDAAFCFVCINAEKKHMISSTKSEHVFTKYGFTNWKKALEKNKGFLKHENSDSHKEATERLITAPISTKCDIDEMMSDIAQEEKETNRKMLLKILSSIRYLARQALPLRGNWDDYQKNEFNSNFYQLLKLRSEVDKMFAEWLTKKSNKFTSPKMQNEMIEVILRDIAKNIQSAEIYSILADETADISNVEQLAFCI